MNVDTGQFAALTEEVAQLQADFAMLAQKQAVADSLVSLVMFQQEQRAEMRRTRPRPRPAGRPRHLRLVRSAP